MARLTKKEANAKMRAKYGTLWFDRPDGREERNALQAGKQPVRKTKAPRTRRARKAKQLPKPLYTVLSGALVVTGPGRTRRPVAIVEVSHGKNRAFYLSTGTGGMTEKGSWVNFGGYSDYRGGWFIKPKEEFGSKKAYPEVTPFLAQDLGTEVGEILDTFRHRFPRYPVFDESDDLESRKDPNAQNGSITLLNQYLASFKAIAAWRGEKGEKAAARQMIKSLYDPPPTGAAKDPEKQYQTVYSAYRARFNSMR